MRPVPVSGAWLIALLSAGCGEDAVRHWIEAPPSATSYLFATEHEMSGQASLVLFAETIDGPIDRPLSGDEQSASRISVLFYDASLTELGLLPGLQVLTGVTDPRGRALPVPDEIHELDPATGKQSQPASASDALARARIRVPTFEECAATRGCLAQHEGALVCEVPCVSRSPITPPNVPESPDAIVTAPARPDFGTCPTGWMASAHPFWPEQPSCTPPAIPAAQSCAESEMQAHGESSCRPVGSDCPSGSFSTRVPAGPTTFFVDPSSMGGIGTIDAPYANLRQAIDAGATYIALSRGVHIYDGGTLRSDLEIYGACAAETTIMGQNAATTLVANQGARVVLYDARVSSLDMRSAGSGSALGLDGVVLAADAVGLLANGGRIELTASKSLVAASGAIRANGGEIVITDSAIHDGCISLSSASSISIERSSLSSACGQGTIRLLESSTLNGQQLTFRGADPFLFARSSSVRLDDVSVEGTGGARLEQTSTATLSAVQIHDPSSTAFRVVEGSEITLEDTWIETEQAGALDLRGAGNSVMRRAQVFVVARIAVIAETSTLSISHSLFELESGAAVNLFEGSRVEIERSRFSRRNQDSLAFAVGSDASANAGPASILELNDVEIESQPSDPEMLPALVIRARGWKQTTRLLGHRVLISGDGPGILLEGALASSELSDLEMRDTSLGLSLTDGAQATVSRVLIQNDGGAFRAVDPGTQLQVSDFWIARRAMTPTPIERCPDIFGFFMAVGADLSAQRGVVESIGRRGLFVEHDSHASVSDVIFRNIGATSIDIEESSILELARVELINIARQGIRLVDFGTNLVGHDVRLLGTHVPDTPCDRYQDIHDVRVISAERAANFQLERFEIEGDKTTSTGARWETRLDLGPNAGIVRLADGIMYQHRVAVDGLLTEDEADDFVGVVFEDNDVDFARTSE